MSEKHTPGPWHAVPANNLSGYWQATVHMSQTAQCKVVADTMRETNANAQIIAAAPELLEACIRQNQVIDALLARLIGLDEAFMPSKSPYWPVVVQGNAVISKARGQ